MKKMHSDFILFKTEDEQISVDVRIEDETVWLTQEQMALLFERDRSVIIKKTSKTPESEIKKAKQIRSRYFEYKEINNKTKK